MAQVSVLVAHESILVVQGYMLVAKESVIVAQGWILVATDRLLWHKIHFLCYKNRLLWHNICLSFLQPCCSLKSAKLCRADLSRPPIVSTFRDPSISKGVKVRCLLWDGKKGGWGPVLKGERMTVLGGNYKMLVPRASEEWK